MSAAGDDQEQLLAEQIAYYRARAPEYSAGVIPGAVGGGESEAALDEFRPAGDVLELACGPGTWTPQLLRHATSVTAVDASPEMIAIAASRAGRAARVRFVEADLFSWKPDRRYDVVLFGYDGYRTPDELIEGESSATVLRRLTDGTPHRAVKVPHEPAELEQRLARLGWRITVTQTSGPFYWGAGSRA